MRKTAERVELECFSSFWLRFVWLFRYSLRLWKCRTSSLCDLQPRQLFRSKQPRADGTNQRWAFNSKWYHSKSDLQLGRSFQQLHQWGRMERQLQLITSIHLAFWWLNEDVCLDQNWEQVLLNLRYLRWTIFSRYRLRRWGKSWDYSFPIPALTPEVARRLHRSVGWNP